MFLNFLKRSLENLRRAAVHGIGKGRFLHGLPPAVAETIIMGCKAAGDLAQDVFTR